MCPSSFHEGQWSISRSEIGTGNWTEKRAREKITIAQRGNPQESSIAQQKTGGRKRGEKSENEKEEGKIRNEKEKKKQ
jgi:hypothetical protein